MLILNGIYKYGYRIIDRPRRSTLNTKKNDRESMQIFIRHQSSLLSIYLRFVIDLFNARQLTTIDMIIIISWESEIVCVHVSLNIEYQVLSKYLPHTW